jgi:catechol 2,3-dioxygenase-like lactoylglutathione lyase family enzyme
MGAVVNHVGLCVHDLERSRRFYEQLLGFVPDGELRPPDGPTATLLGLEPPLGMRVAYLRLGAFRLELLAYTEREALASRRRTMDEPGLTHLSVGVDDPAAVAARVADLGGSVVAGTDIGMAVFVRDPDGQLIELLDTAYV